MYPSRVLGMQVSRPLFYATSKEPHRAHTISQRLRSLKRMPPELIPLGLVMGVALGAAAYSSVKKLLTDKTLRLHRNTPEQREH